MWKSQRCPGSPWALKLSTGGCRRNWLFGARGFLSQICTLFYQHHYRGVVFFHLPNWQSQLRQSQSAITETILTFFFSPLCSQNRWTSASNGVGSITMSAAAASLINTGIIQNTLPVLQERRSWEGGSEMVLEEGGQLILNRGTVRGEARWGVSYLASGRRLRSRRKVHKPKSGDLSFWGAAAMSDYRGDSCRNERRWRRKITWNL